MKDGRLRTASFWIASCAGSLCLVGIVLPPLRAIFHPATLMVAGLALVLFLRILFSRTYRDGVNAANREMQGGDPWPGRRIKFSDPEWGLFGKRVGLPPLLWLRAVMLLGNLPLILLNHWFGIDVVGLWFAGAFVAMELSLMYLALSQPEI